MALRDFIIYYADGSDPTVVALDEAATTDEIRAAAFLETDQEITIGLVNLEKSPPVPVTANGRARGAAALTLALEGTTAIVSGFFDHRLNGRPVEVLVDGDPSPLQVPASTARKPFDASSVMETGSALSVRISGDGLETVSNEVSFTPLGSGADLANVEMLDQIALDGATATFWDAATGGSRIVVPVYYDLNGTPSVLATDGAFVEITPETSADTRGVEENPFVLEGLATGAASAQGYDINLVDAPGIKTTMHVAYDETKNVEKQRGPRLSIAAPTAYLKHIATANYTDSGSAESYGIVSVLGARPPVDFLRPATAHPDKSIVRSYPDGGSLAFQEHAVVAGAISLSDANARTPVHHYANGYMGELLRTMANRAARWGSTGTYQSSAGPFANEAMLRLHLGPDDGTKRTMARKLAQLGSDRAGEYARGWRNSGGAGQFQILLETMYAAAFVLNDAEILAAAQGTKQNVTEQCSFVAAADVGYIPLWADVGDGQDQSRRNRSIKPQHEGQPWLFQQGGVVRTGTSSMDVEQRYLPVSSKSLPTGLLFILLLRNGPGGISGADAWLSANGGNGARDATNPQMAAVWYMDRYFNWRPNQFGPLQSWVYDFYDQVRDTIDIPVYSGPDVAYATQSPALRHVAPTSDGFSWDFSGVRLGTSGRTRLDLRYGSDQIGWVELEGAGDTGAVTGLPPQPTYVQIRTLNGDGFLSDWSSNHSYTNHTTYGGERMVVTPTGSAPASAPAFTDAPELVLPLYPQTPEHAYIAAPADLGAADIVVSAGVARAAGIPAPVKTYRKVIDGAPVGTPGNAARLILGRNDEGTIAVEVTLANASGSVTATTAATSIPPVPSIPAGTIIDTDFDGSFERYYPAVYDSFAAETGADFAWSYFAPNAVSADEGEAEPVQTTPGNIRRIKRAGQPKLRGNAAAARPVTAGGTYRIRADVPVGVQTPVLGNTNFRVYDGSGGLLFSDFVGTEGAPMIWQIDEEVTATDGTLLVEVHVSTSTGGTVGGDPKLSRLSITAVGDTAPAAAFEDDLSSPDETQFAVYASSGVPGPLAFAPGQVSVAGQGATFVRIARALPASFVPVGSPVLVEVELIDSAGTLAQAGLGNNPAGGTSLAMTYGSADNTPRTMVLETTWPEGDANGLVYVAGHARSTLNGTLVLGTFRVTPL